MVKSKKNKNKNLFINKKYSRKNSRKNSKYKVQNGGILKPGMNIIIYINNILNFIKSIFTGTNTSNERVFYFDNKKHDKNKLLLTHSLDTIFKNTQQFFYPHSFEENLKDKIKSILITNSNESSIFSSYNSEFKDVINIANQNYPNFNIITNDIDYLTIKNIPLNIFYYYLIALYNYMKNNPPVNIKVIDEYFKNLIIFNTQLTLLDTYPRPEEKDKDSKTKFENLEKNPIYPKYIIKKNIIGYKIKKPITLGDKYIIDVIKYEEQKQNNNIIEEKYLKDIALAKSKIEDILKEHLNTVFTEAKKNALSNQERDLKKQNAIFDNFIKKDKELDEKNKELDEKNRKLVEKLYILKHIKIFPKFTYEPNITKPTSIKQEKNGINFDNEFYKCVNSLKPLLDPKNHPKISDKFNKLIDEYNKILDELRKTYITYNFDSIVLDLDTTIKKDVDVSIVDNIKEDVKKNCTDALTELFDNIKINAPAPTKYKNICKFLI